MKIICDCGEISEFIIQPNETKDYNEEDGLYALLTGKINIIAEHDQAWIVCNKCNNRIWIFT